MLDLNDRKGEGRDYLAYLWENLDL